MIKLLSLFTGIGAFEKALERLNIEYELVAFSEIDKYAIKSYCSIHNVDENKNLGDITKVDISKIPNFDIMTWGFPCQDISIAGKLAGIKEGTRSGLYYYGYKILKEKMPKYSIIENVKNLTSKRFKGQFESILNDIAELGYNNYWQVLNAKDYGIPQNRERVFIISIRKDIDNKDFQFPTPIELKIKLKDILEDKVEDKYYLTEKGIGRLIKKDNRLLRECKNPDISSCLIAGYSKMSGSNNQFVAETPPFLLVKEATKKGYTEAFEGDSINISYPNSVTKRGRVGREVSQTILTSPNIGIIKEIQENENTAGAIFISEDGKHPMKIRRLTILECWRLMGFDDEDLKKAKDIPTSDTQLYKQAGNSIVVNVLVGIFRELL